jgi:hypothetical protein
MFMYVIDFRYSAGLKVKSKIHGRDARAMINDTSPRI